MKPIQLIVLYALAGLGVGMYAESWSKAIGLGLIIASIIAAIVHG